MKINRLVSRLETLTSAQKLVLRLAQELEDDLTIGQSKLWASYMADVVCWCKASLRETGDVGKALIGLSGEAEAQ